MAGEGRPTGSLALANVDHNPARAPIASELSCINGDVHSQVHCSRAMHASWHDKGA